MFQCTTTRYSIAAILLVLFMPHAIAEQASAQKDQQQKPPLQLATKYQRYTAVEDYWLSEKLDGVRGYWTGTKLLTRSGNVLSPPPWFTQHWPKIAMDGELWSERGQFEQISGCIRRKTSNDKCWKNLRLMIFDLPDHKGNFTERITGMKQIIAANKSPHLAMIAQQRVNSKADLYTRLNQVIDDKGEGLMLHLASGVYQSGRSKHLLKLKKHQDAEAIVIAHLPGKGKFRGLLGAIKVKTPEGITFKIGSGFSDQERKQPPKIGSTITYKYIGKTQRGVPRFASFLRIKHQH
ncbi:MAG: DNA ligase [Cognaticolwellia sp.]